MNMIIPGLVAARSLEVSGTAYWNYCRYVNRIASENAIMRGQCIPERYGTKHKFQDRVFRFTFIISDYGSEKFRVEVHRSVWNELPPDVNPLMVNEGTEWNYVYDYADADDTLTFHLPGSWSELLANYELPIPEPPAF